MKVKPPVRDQNVVSLIRQDWDFAHYYPNLFFVSHVLDGPLRYQFGAIHQTTAAGRVDLLYFPPEGCGYQIRSAPPNTDFPANPANVIWVESNPVGGTCGLTVFALTTSYGLDSAVGDILAWLPLKGPPDPNIGIGHADSASDSLFLIVGVNPVR
jgi:hypothetical protein